MLSPEPSVAEIARPVEGAFPFLMVTEAVLESVQSKSLTEPSGLNCRSWN